ncbi:MAG: hypothetical protein ABI904_00865 [Chloroflexota bacterium]
MHNNTINETQETQPVYIGGRKVAVMRNDGALCDIRRHNDGFLYAPHRVAMSEELLETLSDNVVLQFTNLDSGDVWTCIVHDFRHMSEPIRFGKYEPQRAVEIARMNHTIQGKVKSKTKRVNELLHIDVTPVPDYSQPSLFG